MNWRKLGLLFAKKGLPLLGTVIAGPAGGTIGAAVAGVLGLADDPAAIAGEVQNNPAAVEKLVNFQSANSVELQKLAVDKARIEAEERIAHIRQVNETMRTEAKSDKWPQYSWRPWNGFLYPLAVILVYFVLPIAGVDVPDVPVWVWGVWGSVLGVTAWTRGKEKQAAAGGGRGILPELIEAIKR